MKFQKLQTDFRQDYRVDKRGGLKDNQLQKRQPRINADSFGKLRTGNTDFEFVEKRPMISKNNR